MNELSLTPSQSHSIMFAIYISFKITVMILYVQEVVTPFYVVSYYIKWVTTHGHTVFAVTSGSPSI